MHGRPYRLNRWSTAQIPPPGGARIAPFVSLRFVVLGLVAWITWRYVHAKAAVPPDTFHCCPAAEEFLRRSVVEFFVDGMTDQLITDLAKVGSLRVISGTSVMQYKGAKKGLPEIARELNVDAIVEGSLTRSGQRVRVTAQLIQASYRPAPLGRDIRPGSWRYSESAGGGGERHRAASSRTTHSHAAGSAVARPTQLTQPHTMTI